MLNCSFTLCRIVRNNASPRPTTSHLAPKPITRPPPASPPRQPIPKPVPPPAKPVSDTEDDDDYDMGFGVFVTDEGGYQLVAPEETIQPVRPPVVPPVVPAVLDRKGLERSTSLNFESSILKTQQASQGSGARHGAAGSQSTGTGALTGSQWKRTMSAEALSRQQAIARVIGTGSGSSQTTAQPLRPVVNSVAPARELPYGAKAGPSVGMDEYERMKAELETMRRAQAKATEDMLEYKKEAQKRQGEAVGIRKQLVEVRLVKAAKGGTRRF